MLSFLRSISYFVLLNVLLGSSLCLATEGKLKGTAGVTSIEGAAGGGLIPWAVIGSYASRDELGFSAFRSEVRVDEYRLRVHGFTVGLHDRVEVSMARQELYSDPLARSIRQNVLGVKVRLLGDLVYDSLPVVSVGFQHKDLIDDEVIGLVGAKNDSGNDIYLSAAKAWIDGPFSRTSFVNANLRYSDANETGLLGYGGEDEKSNWLVEAAAGSFITNDIAVGLEYRQKRNHLSAIDEDSWMDVFVAWFPSKSFSVTAAYLDLGEIVAQEDQTGFYLSLQASF